MGERSSGRSVAERQAQGARLRRELPLARNGDWRPSAHRPDPVATLERQGTTRVPELLGLRHERMALSAFAFFRGAAAIMADDLATTSACGLRAQLCGDAHLLNFGLFETPERTLVFGLNDFDETLPGPVEWDLKRLAASVEIAGRDLGFTASQRRKAVLATVRGYREAMLGFAEMRNLELWYTRLPAQDLSARLEATADRTSQREVSRRIAKAMRKDHLMALGRLVDMSGTELRFRSEPPVLVPIEELLAGDPDAQARYTEVITSALEQYRASLPVDRRVLVDQYEFVHMARKVVGVGSVGTRCWAVLMLGRDVRDPLVLQLKEAQPSVLAPYAGETLCPSQGQRVVEGQRLMQAASDHLLGWYRLRALDGVMRDFYVRQLWDGKASIAVEHLTPKGLRVYGASCGWTLARGHARSGDRVALASYLGSDAELEEALATFAETYADLNERDHGRLLEAIDSGRLPVASEPLSLGASPSH